MKKRDVISKYNLPVEIGFCKKCTTPNQRPRITFDEEGVCSVCNYFEYKKKVDSGLGLIPGQVVPMPSKTSGGAQQKLPHIGWDELVSSNEGNDHQQNLLQNINPSEAGLKVLHNFLEL